VERVLIAYDRDEAGDRAAAKLAERLGGEGIECFRVLFPAGQDANALITSVEDPAGALAELLRGAVARLGCGVVPPAAVEPVEPERGRSGAAVPVERVDVVERPVDVRADRPDSPDGPTSFLAAKPPGAGRLASPVPAGPPVGPERAAGRRGAAGRDR
jgi:DNA primase